MVSMIAHTVKTNITAVRIIIEVRSILIIQGESERFTLSFKKLLKMFPDIIQILNLFKITHDFVLRNVKKE
jgi:hypothetical protein